MYPTTTLEHIYSEIGDYFFWPNFPFNFLNYKNARKQNGSGNFKHAFREKLMKNKPAMSWRTYLLIDSIYFPLSQSQLHEYNQIVPSCRWSTFLLTYISIYFSVIYLRERGKYLILDIRMYTILKICNFLVPQVFLIFLSIMSVVRATLRLFIYTIYVP